LAVAGLMITICVWSAGRGLPTISTTISMSARTGGPLTKVRDNIGSPKTIEGGYTAPPPAFLDLANLTVPSSSRLRRSGTGSRSLLDLFVVNNAC
jgi:hypothetical protein